MMSIIRDFVLGFRGLCSLRRPLEYSPVTSSVTSFLSHALHVLHYDSSTRRANQYGECRIGVIALI
jgi:hypothetical protein